MLFLSLNSPGVAGVPVSQGDQGVFAQPLVLDEPPSGGRARAQLVTGERGRGPASA